MPRKARSKQTLSKAQSRAVRKIAEKVVDAEVEDKKFCMVSENNQLYHNKPGYMSKILRIIEPGYLSGAQSTGALGVKTVRVGDEIGLKNINIRFWLSNKDDRPNVMYKGVLFWLPSDMAPSDAIVYATQTNKMLDRYNTNQIRIVDKFLVKSTNNYAVDANNHEKSYLATLNKSYKSKKIKYDELSGIPKGMDLAFALVCYDAYGTLQTDNIASCAFNYIMQFKDL